MIQDLNTDNNSCAAWIAKFLINRKVEFVFGYKVGIFNLFGITVIN